MFSVIAAAAIAAQPAAAAASAASVGSVSRPDMVQSVHRYATCVAQQRSVAARAVLAMDPRTRDYQQALNHLNRYDMDCQNAAETDRTWRAHGVMFAGGMAEELLRRDVAGRDLAPLVAYDPARPPIVARNAAELMAICVVRTGPSETTRLLATAPATAEEYERLRAMSPLLSGCTPPGQSRFTREGLRAMIAIAAYRLVAHSSAN